MQSEEDPLSDFLERVFKKMGNRNTHIVLVDTDDVEAGDSRLVSEFRKKVNLISVALKDIHSADLELFFDAVPLSRRNIFTLMCSHCFEMCGEDAFFALAYTCSYVSFTLNFCEERGSEQFSKLSRMCVREIFAFRLREDFEAQGGWAGLENFALAHNLPLFIDFICACFADRAKLLTRLRVGGVSRDYGLHDGSTLDSWRGVFAVLESLLIASYYNEFRDSPQYLVQVLDVLKQARIILEQSKVETSSPRLLVRFSRFRVTLSSTPEKETSSAPLPRERRRRQRRRRR